MPRPIYLSTGPMVEIMEWFVDAQKYFRQGGPIMFPLLAVSMWVWGLIAERLYFFSANSKKKLRPESLVRGFLEQTHPLSAGSRNVCRNLAVDFANHRSGNIHLDHKILDQHWLSQKKRIHKGLSLIAALAAAAPLMGLFGTVLGMIDTFEVISAFGTGNAKALAGGISEALISTQSGLLVGIPALLMCIFLRQEARRLEARLKETRIIVKRDLKE